MVRVDSCAPWPSQARSISSRYPICSDADSSSSARHFLEPVRDWSGPLWVTALNDSTHGSVRFQSDLWYLLMQNSILHNLRSSNPLVSKTRCTSAPVPFFWTRNFHLVDRFARLCALFRALSERSPVARDAESDSARRPFIEPTRLEDSAHERSDIRFLRPRISGTSTVLRDSTHLFWRFPSYLGSHIAQNRILHSLVTEIVRILAFSTIPSHFFVDSATSSRTP